jgi:hypothetical protein
MLIFQPQVSEGQQRRHIVDFYPLDPAVSFSIVTKKTS